MEFNGLANIVMLLDTKTSFEIDPTLADEIKDLAMAGITAFKTYLDFHNKNLNRKVESSFWFDSGMFTLGCIVTKLERIDEKRSIKPEVKTLILDQAKRMFRYLYRYSESIKHNTAILAWHDVL